MSYDGTSLAYLALEPYLGLDIVNDSGFGAFTKLGYEWRNYALMAGSNNGYYYEDEFDAFNFTASAGIQYSF